MTTISVFSLKHYKYALIGVMVKCLQSSIFLRLKLEAPTFTTKFDYNQVDFNIQYPHLVNFRFSW